MDTQERQIIEGLFTRLGEVERQSGERDAEAEAFIRSRVADQPNAPYYMAQTIIVQEQALANAQQRIEELERELASRPAGGFLGSLFGGGARVTRPQHRPAASAAAPTMHPMVPQAGRGGGFLAGAAQTAVSVAGGMLLGNMLASAFTGGEVLAEEAGDAGAADMGADLGFDEEFF